ncbi:zinc finger MYM-type protein 1-like [Olea europaea var. sylvestris]|uniref:zinc finger MYM-type protein 1-like n=1 Tax=Olea europaea var. sylvestris TaxID=158386 RepID=UPI000C1D0E3C|nr:zinc finger MYM-type protein 1-like [Olea europaea var. sylvestris]
MDKYFNGKKRKEKEETSENLTIEEQQNQNDIDNDHVDEQKENKEIIEPENMDESKQNDENHVQHEDLNQENCFSLNFNDPGNWKDIHIDQKIRNFLVEVGPKRVDDIFFPRDNKGRHFESSQYKRLMANGQTTDRRWLVYSISLDKIFCFCCKLFKTEKMDKNIGQLGNDGYNDWHNMHRRLTHHEVSKEHIGCMISWMELENRLQTKHTIDESIQLSINKEREHWRQVLTRIIAIVKRLAKNTLAFRGDCEQLYVEDNGLFLQMIEMVAEFDPIMEEHIRRAQAREIQYTYLGPKIQNELIQMLAGEVRSAIVTKVKHAKYFSVILDCTPDASNEEQMSLVIRCVDDSIDSPMVQEYWIEFLKVDDASGFGLFIELKNVLKNLELDIDNIRGQGYDNGANMSGRHRGVQKRLLEINPRAFYTPCGCYSLNLALYKVQGLTLKPLSQTRWESHVESVQPIKEQSVQIRDTLLDLANIVEDPKTKSEAESFAIYELENFEFLLGIVIWYKLLHAINTVNKFFQAENMDINEAIKLLQALISFLEDYRESGFASAMDEAKQMASEMGIEAVFQKRRSIRRKKQFDESGTEEVTYSAEDSFRVEYFLFIIDQARSSLQTRFEQFTHYEEIFGFLFNMDRLKSMPVDSVLKSCMNLEQYLEHNGHSDILVDDLCSELIVSRCYLTSETKRAIDVLHYLKKMNGCFPNACIAYKILLTIPVTVASAERSFSKLKLIKTYIRSTMS